MNRSLRGALALVCALLLPAFAWAATLSATPANVWPQVLAAQPGDVVQLQPGAYVLDLWNLPKAAPGVTVMPAQPGTVTASEINTSNSPNLKISGIEVLASAATQYAVTCSDPCQGQVFDHLKVHNADNVSLSGVGLFLRNATGVTVQNSEFSWLGVAMSAMDSPGLIFKGNLIHDVNVDGIDLAGDDGATVTGNTITNLHPGDGDHPDCIQWWTTAATPNPSHIVISGNRCERAAGGIPQGVFGAGGSAISITGNVLLGTMYNGISMSGVAGGEITGNFLQPYPDMGTQILVRGGTSNVTIDKNAAPIVSNYNPAGEPANTNITIGTNVVTTPAAAGDYTQLIAWQTATGAAPAPTPTPTPTPAPTPTPVPAVDPLQATVDAQTAQITALKAKIAKAQAALLAYPSNTAKQLQNKIANALAALK